MNDIVENFFNIFLVASPVVNLYKIQQFTFHQFLVKFTNVEIVTCRIPVTMNSKCKNSIW